MTVKNLEVTTISNVDINYCGATLCGNLLSVKLYLHLNTVIPAYSELTIGTIKLGDNYSLPSESGYFAINNQDNNNQLWGVVSSSSDNKILNVRIITKGSPSTSSGWIIGAIATVVAFN